MSSFARIVQPALADIVLLQRSSIADLLMILREVFAKEPPVRNRQQMPQPQPQPTQTPPPLPPLPPGVGPTQIAQPQALSQPSTPLATQTPPQLPPKPGAAAEMQPSTQSTQTAERYQSPPALPPLPPKEHGHLRNVSAGHTPLTSPSRASQQFAHPNPLGQPRPPSIHQGFVPYERNAVGAMSPSAGHQNAAFSHPTGPVPVPQQPYHQGPPAQYPSHQSNIPPAQQQQAGPPYTPNQAYPPNHQIPPVAAAPAPKKDAPDLLTSPFELELPSFAPAGPAPPIPPNPEKDAILHALSQTLAETLRAQAAQSDTAAQSLTSQSHSLHTAITTLQSEVNTLNALHTTLTSNTTILQQSIHRADATIADAQARSASASASAPSSTPSTSTAVGTPDPRSGLPPIDEVLVAPTVVGKQLYDLVAEEQGLQHALYALQAALVRGVIGVDSWSRHTRGLAREAFLKKALTRKIGRGMGLEETFS